MSEKRNVATSQQEEKSAKKPAERKGKAVIWLGPTIVGVAVTGTVYRNGFTPQFQNFKKELPAVKRLLVGIEDAARARRALTDPQSAESLCYRKTLAYVGKGAEA